MLKSLILEVNGIPNELKMPCSSLNLEDPVYGIHNGEIAIAA